MNEWNENAPEASEATEECCGGDATGECTEPTSEAGECATEAAAEDCSSDDAGDCSAEASDDSGDATE